MPRVRLNLTHACSICKRPFGSATSAEQHIAGFHARSKQRKDASAVELAPKVRGAGGDESYADRAIQALGDKAAGLPHEEWLLPAD